MLTREEAITLVKTNTSKRNIIYHVLAVEAIMRRLASFFGENADIWGLIGLLHDLDYEKTEATPEKHGLLTEQMLKSQVPDDIVRAIKTHNASYTGILPENRCEKALVAADAISGLLVACALVMPSKKLVDVKIETVAKKFKDKDFARGADRQRILICEEIGISKEKFFEIALDGLKEISVNIGL